MGQLVIQRGAGGGGGGGGTPGGSDTQVQFNDGGAFGGDSGLVFNKTTNRLTPGALSVSDAGTNSSPTLVIGSGGGAIAGWHYAAGWSYSDGSGNTQLRLLLSGQRLIRLRSDWWLGWCSGDPDAVGEDTHFERAAAKIVNLGDGSTGGGSLQLKEMTAPAGVANAVRLYAEDNGSGKTRLMAIFGSGAAQQITIEP